MQQHADELYGRSTQYSSVIRASCFSVLKTSHSIVVSIAWKNNTVTMFIGFVKTPSYIPDIFT